MKNSAFKGSLILLLVSFLWGISFIFQSMASNYMDAYTILYLRSLIGALTILPFMLFFLKKDKKNNIKYNKKDMIIAPLLCGIALCFASLFQQLGLETVSAGKTGFLTSLYIILVPIFGLFLHKKCGLNVYISIFIALIGLLLLSFDFESGFTFSSGDLLILVGTLFFAIQILLVDHYSKKTNVYYLSFGQLIIQGIISFIIRLIIGFDVNAFLEMMNLESIISILFIGIVSSGIAYTLQMVGQKSDVNPTVASLILSLESVFSAVSAVIIYQFYKFSDVNQNMSIEEIIGSIVMFVAVIFSQLPSSWFKIKKKSEIKEIDGKNETNNT